MTPRMLRKRPLRPTVAAVVLIGGSICLGGCMHNPYVNRTIVYDDGSEAKKFFAYGNYCGAGHPGPEVDMTEPPTPVDDLDEACRLHDKCHRSPDHDLDMCDLGFSMILTEAREVSDNEECRNLYFEMSEAIMTRFWSRQHIYTPYRTPQVVSEAGSMVISRIWLELTKNVSEFPDEGTCFFELGPFGDEDNPSLVEAFRLRLDAAEFAREVVENPENAASMELPESLRSDDTDSNSKASKGDPALRDVEQ